MYKDDVTATLTAIGQLNPDFVDATIAALAVKEAYRTVAGTALDDARELLESI